MCGIVGAVAKRNVGSILLDGLSKLEYRGYDSAGMAVISPTSEVQLVRSVGKVSNLASVIKQSALKGTVGIAHTRWATHGEPTEINAHPQISSDLAVVHNGIIENHVELREKLQKLDYKFQSDTDTEVIAHLVHYHQKQGNSLLESLQAASKELHGAYAIAVVSQHEKDVIVAIRHGSPLLVGLGIEENFISSDTLALVPYASEFIYLDEGDSVIITRKTNKIFDINSKPVVRESKKISVEETAQSQKGEYKHFMIKEIFEQPDVIKSALEGRFIDNKVVIESFGFDAKEAFSKTKNILIVACGTSYNSGMVAKYWIESIANIPCSVEIASEFKYRDVAINPGTLFITISQSGETADTIAALKKAKTMNFIKCLSICNIADSTLFRGSDLHILTRAGREVGVASTKAFTTQLVVLLLFALGLKQQNDSKPLILEQDWQVLLNAIEIVLEQMPAIGKISKQFFDKKSTIFLGRGALAPIADEGALKLKEISYIHAESYPAGELKHGPLALVDQDMPVVVIAPNNELLKKIKSNIKEVHARRGQLFVFTDCDIIKEEKRLSIIKIPTVHALLTPILYAIPLQLLAYLVAVGKGTDIDQPRNLAKSVTVE